METAQLKNLGLVVKSHGGENSEADFDIGALRLANPVSRAAISRVTFTVWGDRLVATAPAELVGIAPIPLALLHDKTDLEQQIAAAFKDVMVRMQRRSSELQALGLRPLIDPSSLSLWADVPSANYRFRIVADRLGNFRLAEAMRDEAPVQIPSTSTVFELSEFRELPALNSYLKALVGDEGLERSEPSVHAVAPISFNELINRFAGGALLPPTSSLELLVELQVHGVHYRFAAARVVGRSFRGLLAGAQGKLWAERFELDSFPGVAELVARVLKVPVSAVEIVSPGVH